MPAPLNLAGQRFGRLLAVAPTKERTRTGSVKWLCRCDCGRELLVTCQSLRKGTQSCGCLMKESTRDIGRRNATHGHAAIGGKPSPEYRSWQAMLTRCLNSKSRTYQWYGARGVRVCARWQRSFEAFLSDMGNRPPQHSLDRIDNEGHYSCGHCEDCVARSWDANCKWSTAAEQARNRRSPLKAR